MKLKFTFEEKLLSLIILIGVVLRFYHLYEMPFMHDEFSALFRTRFDSFSEVISIGVQEGDTHPPGVQVFLWLYVKLVGENEFLLKLPFVLMGVLSIPLVYKIGKEWFNKNVGLISAVFIATSQYVLTYSVIIRPYISGLFLGLLMVYFWTGLVKGKYRVKNYIGFTVFAVLSAYNHHFGMLFTAIVGLTGLLLVQKGQLGKYFFSGVVIVLLYLPNLSIFLSQLGQGGLDGWLGKPDLYFPLNYIKYIFHFSGWSYIMALFIVFIGLLYSWTKKLSSFYIVSLFWFFIPLLIGLVYSIYVSPVIQYSMLIFTFPYFLFIVFGLYPAKISQKVTTAIVLLLLLVNVSTLIVNRKHYQILYETRHLQFLKQINKVEQKNEASILIANHPRINDFYQKKYKWDFNYINYFEGVSDEIELKKVEEIVKNSKQPFFIYGGQSLAKPEIVQIIQQKYPYCISNKDYYASHLYVFSKENNNDLLKPYFIETNDFKASKVNWKNIEIDYESSGALLEAEKEWGPAYSIKLATLLKHRNDVLTVKLEFKDTLKKDLLLVTEIKHQESLLYYSVSSSSDPNLKEGDHSIIYKTIELSGVKLPSKDISFTTYIWNKSKSEFILKNYEVAIRKGNPIQYGLFEPILEDYE